MADYVMYNRTAASLTKIDPDLSGLSLEDLEKIDLSKENVYFRPWMKNMEWWECRAILSAANNKEIYERCYEAYFKDIDWINIDKMDIRIAITGYVKDNSDFGKLHFAITAEEFVSNEDVKRAWVESINMEGPKADILREKMSKIPWDLNKIKSFEVEK